MRTQLLLAVILSCGMLSCTNSTGKKDPITTTEVGVQLGTGNTAIIEKSKTPVEKAFEKFQKKGNVILSDLIKEKNIADRIISTHGKNYYDFLLKLSLNDKEPKEILNTDRYGNEGFNIYSTSMGNNYFFELFYDNKSDFFRPYLSVNGSEVASDGSFMLEENNNWQVVYLNKDEFGDPDTTKPYIAVPSTSASTSDVCGAGTLYIAVSKENKKSIILYSDGVLGYTTFFDVVGVKSIAVKNKNTGEIFRLSDYVLTDGLRVVLSEKDSQKIKDLCNDRECNFSIKYNIRHSSSDWTNFGAEDYAVNIQNFENGIAYGLNNAIMAYFYKAF